MFWGEFPQPVDGRGRLTIPPPLRADLANGLVVTRGLDGCLLLFPAGRWERVASLVGELPLTRAVARSVTRLLLGGASEQRLDGQGRFLLPDHLRQYARLDTGAVLIGAGDHLEIWAEATWTAEADRLANESSNMAESLSQLGFALT